MLRAGELNTIVLVGYYEECTECMCRCERVQFLLYDILLVTEHCGVRQARTTVQERLASEWNSVASRQEIAVAFDFDDSHATGHGQTSSYG